MCPKKVIETERDLAEHLQSKGHKKALLRYYKQHSAQLKSNMRRVKLQVTRKTLFNMPKYQKLVRLGIHFKLLA